MQRQSLTCLQGGLPARQAGDLDKKNLPLDTITVERKIPGSIGTPEMNPLALLLSGPQGDERRAYNAEAKNRNESARCSCQYSQV